MASCLNLPPFFRESAEVLEVSVDFFTLQNEEYTALESQNEERTTSVCSPDIISDLLAVQACGTGSWHQPKGENSVDKIMFAGQLSSAGT